jgi:hypothetical protein
MKKILLILFLLGNFAYAQTFILGTTDPAGDAGQPYSPDAKALSYMLTSDSIFFKMEFHNRIDNLEWNITIALDTNMNPSDGAPWAGLNTSMNYDLNFRMFYHPGFPPISGYIVAANQIASGYSFYAEITDTSTFVAGISLAEHGITGPFQIIGGCGLAIGDIDDDIPDSGIIPILSSGVKFSSLNSALKFSLYPNPQINLSKLKWRIRPSWILTIMKSPI